MEKERIAQQGNNRLSGEKKTGLNKSDTFDEKDPEGESIKG